MIPTLLSVEKPIGHTTLEDILRTAAWIQHELSTGLAPYGITWIQWNVLHVLYKNAPDVMRSSDIGNHLTDGTPDVTRILDRLEKRGLVLRKRDAQDKRIISVSLSEDGILLLERVKTPVDKLLNRICGSLNSAEQMLLSDFLDRMKA